jgi:hypothetical protein
MRFASMLLLFLVLLWPQAFFAMQFPDNPPPPEPGGPPTPPLPIDDYLPLLFIFGLIYGAYKISKALREDQDLKS